MPEKKTAVTLSVDDDVLKWFETQGESWSIASLKRRRIRRVEFQTERIYEAFNRWNRREDRANRQNLQWTCQRRLERARI